jgi:hypothetical protein
MNHGSDMMYFAPNDAMMAEMLGQNIESISYNDEVDWKKDWEESPYEELGRWVQFEFDPYFKFSEPSNLKENRKRAKHA